MGMSVSLKKATNKTNINHNNREMTEKQRERNDHIDYSRSDENRYLVQDDIKELYAREFGDALQKYNDKQTRSDRKIDDYYKHIEASKKTAVQQEMIIQVGEKEDFRSKEERERANEILEEWFSEFEDRNPNLKVYNAVIHNDEASPHMHLNFVPVAEGYKRGLERQVSFDKAIKQQDDTLNKTRPFEDWRENEVQVLEEKLQERGIERELVGTNEYQDVNEYKEKMDLQQEIEQLKEEVAYKKDELSAFQEKVPDDIKVSAKRQMKNVEVPTGERTIFGKDKTRTEKQPTKNVVISESNYKKLMNAAKSNQELKGRMTSLLKTDFARENKELRAKNEDFREKYNGLVQKFNATVDDYNELARENRSLKSKISDLKADMSLVYESTKDFLKERTNGLKAFKNTFKELVGTIKDKTMTYQDKNNITLERNEFEKIHGKELSKEKDRGMEL